MKAATKLKLGAAALFFAAVGAMASAWGEADTPRGLSEARRLLFQNKITCLTTLPSGYFHEV
jgi:hypothetical protein